VVPGEAAPEDLRPAQRKLCDPLAVPRRTLHGGPLSDTGVGQRV
jgi:hypothetical protein